MDSLQLQHNNLRLLKTLKMFLEVYGEIYLYDEECLLSTFIEKMEENNVE